MGTRWNFEIILRNPCSDRPASGRRAGSPYLLLPTHTALHFATMRIITADETGLIKVVRLESGECLAVSHGEQARAHAVRKICHDHAAIENHSQASGVFARIHVARSAGAVETWDASQSERQGNNGSACSLSLCGAAVDCPAAPVALASLPAASTSSSESSRVLTCNGDGEVQIASVSNNKIKPANFSIRGPISAAIAVRNGGGGFALAAAGRENDLKTWDLGTGQCTWKAKNVPNDFLDMRQTVWITSLCALGVPGVKSGGGGGGGTGLQQMVAGTAHRQVRLYDARAQKRPTHSVDADEHGITTMAVAPDGREVVVADTAGLVRVLDLRKMKWGRRFEGPAGSVRGLAFHPTLPVLACVGLDRMARVYDYRSREQKFQVYLKQRLNAVLFDGEGEVRVAAAEDAEGAKKGKSVQEGADWSGSEGWGSGEEYEMDEGDSSSEEEEGEGAAGGAANRSRTAGGASGGESSEEESSEGEEQSSDDGFEARDQGSGEESDGDDESESEEDEEEALPPPSKRRNAQKTSGSAKKTRSRR